ncbi:MAG TPA: ABC transporter ATP-binding protein [Methanomicrobiales archaeon]|nr:ABC transporter ATP-binding protein [Methanomicrobiales archaeon]
MLDVGKVTKIIGGMTILSDVSLSVGKGEIVGVVGPNGAGKTTLFNIISGISRPTGGSVTFEGEDITGLSPERICRKGIAKTFQIAKSFPGLTARDSVMVGAIFGNHEQASREDAVKLSEETLRFVGFPGERTGSPVRDLNVVELKKVQLARALASRPRLLLFDELMTGLTPAESKESVELVKKIREKGISILMIEHVMSIIMGVSDRVIVLDHGEKIADGHPYEVINNQRVIDSYLGEVGAL